MNIKAFENCSNIDYAIKEIKSNYTTYFKWFPVINKHGNKFELGGTNKTLSAIIPEYDYDGNIVCYPQNNYSQTKCRITTDYIHNNDGFSISDKLKFIEFIENNDLSKIEMVEEEIEVITYEIIKKWKIH